MRHDFEPGKLVVGLVLLGGCACYLAMAAGMWNFPTFALLPAMGVGFVLAGIVSTLAFGIRRRRSRSGEDRG